MQQQPSHRARTLARRAAPIAQLRWPACRTSRKTGARRERRTFRVRSWYIAATPNPRASKSAERGTQVPGANPVVNPREAQALLAPARQLTPQADEREPCGYAPDSSRSLPCWRWRARRRRARRARAWQRRRRAQRLGDRPAATGVAPAPRLGRRRHRRSRVPSRSRRCRATRRRSSTGSPTRPSTRRSRSRRRSGPATRSATSPTSRWRPRRVERRRLRLLGLGLLRAPRRRAAQGRRWTRASSMSWGQRGAGPVDHGLHEPGPRVHRDRRDPVRHLRRGATRTRRRARARAGARC